MLELISPIGHPRVEAQAARRAMDTPVGKRVAIIGSGASAAGTLLFAYPASITVQPVSDASFHCWGYAKRFVNADEIIIHHVQRDGMGVVLDLL